MEKNEIAHFKCLHYVIVSFLEGTFYPWRLNVFFFGASHDCRDYGIVMINVEGAFSYSFSKMSSLMIYWDGQSSIMIMCIAMLRAGLAELGGLEQNITKRDRKRQRQKP